MNRNEIIEIVIAKLTEIQEEGGRERVPITEKTTPIGDLPDFDSMSGVDFASLIDEVLSIGDVGNLGASKDNKRALTVGEIADRILAIAPE